MIFLAPFARNIDNEGDIANFEKCLSMHYTDDIKDYHYVGSGCYSFQMTFVCSPSTFDTLKVKMDLVRKKNEYIPHVYKEHKWWKHDDIIGIKYEYSPRQIKHRHGGGPWTEVFYNKKHSKVYIGRFDL